MFYFVLKDVEDGRVMQEAFMIPIARFLLHTSVSVIGERFYQFEKNYLKM